MKTQPFVLSSRATCNCLKLGIKKNRCIDLSLYIYTDYSSGFKELRGLGTDTAAAANTTDPETSQIYTTAHFVGADDATELSIDEGVGLIYS